MLNDSKNISFLDSYINNKVDEIVNRVVSKLEVSLANGSYSSNGDDAMDRLRTNNEVLDRYQISYSTLVKLRAKDLPNYKIGSDFRYKFSELDNYFRSR